MLFIAYYHPRFSFLQKYVLMRLKEVVGRKDGRGCHLQCSGTNRVSDGKGDFVRFFPPYLGSGIRHVIIRLSGGILGKFVCARKTVACEVQNGFW